MNILFVGDIVGSPGRRLLARWAPRLRAEHAIDAVVVNGENAAGGLGITPPLIEELHDAGADVITLGNHTWRKRELVSALDQFSNTVRPANYPAGVPGKGAVVFELWDGRRLAVVNLIGRVYMDPVDCPFTRAQHEVAQLRQRTPVIVVDFHAEATAEKVAMGWHLDGRCTAVVGTHTHVQTADERVLPQGTAYISDVGMTGPLDGVIGMQRDRVLRRFLTGMPEEFKVASERPGLCGVVIKCDDASGRAESIERIQCIEH